MGRVRDVMVEGVSSPPALFDRILERVRPSEEGFSVRLVTGDALRFRHVQGRDSFGQIREAAHRFAAAIDPRRAPDALKPFAGASTETKVWCHILGALSMDEITANQFLELQHVAPIVFDAMLESVKLGTVNCLGLLETVAIDTAKKGSRSRSCGATGSRSGETSGDDILAS